MGSQTVEANEQGHALETPIHNRAGGRSLVYRLYTHPWFQILLISLICFCCPGVSDQPAPRRQAED